MKKNVLLLTQFFPPETSAGANRVGPMAEVLSKYFRVCVLTLKPSYPSPKDYKEVATRSHDSTLSYAVKRAFAFSPHKGSFPVRALREHAMALRLALRALPARADVVVASSPSMFLGPAALAVARARGARFVWDVRDITWGYARDVAGESPAMNLATKMLERYMLYALRRADLVVGASQGITRALVEGGVEPGKTLTISNGISPGLMEAIVRRTAERSRKPRPVAAYAGLIGYNQGLGVLVEAARSLPGVDLVLAGDGPELPGLKRKAAELGLENVEFRGYLNRAELLDLYAESDVLIAHARSTPTIDATMVPVKLFEYMATGRPIVYAGKGIAADLLCRTGCAATVPPGDPGALAAAISDLLRDPDQARILGDKGRACVQSDFHRDRLMEELAQTLEERFG